jgi:hypothetical protein
MGIGYHDERKVAERLYAVREAGGEDRKGKVRGCEELLGCERWSSVSVAHATVLARVFSTCIWKDFSDNTHLTRSASVNGCNGKLAKCDMSLSVTVLVCNLR